MGVISEKEWRVPVRLKHIAKDASAIAHIRGPMVSTGERIAPKTHGAPKRIFFPPRLVVRDSTRCSC